jgi:indolepyruvate decarboxylase
VRMSVGDFLLKRLAELGARYLFGVPGDYNLWFLEQARRSNHVEFVGCCNELNAAYAADGFARLRGFSALVTTYGVGELSAIAGVAGAYAERVPVVCIIGAPPLGAIEERALLHHTLGDGNFTNMLSSHRDFSLAQARIEPVNARWEIDRVLRSCWIEKRPVYLQLPSDVPAMTIEVPEEPLHLATPTSDPTQLVLAIERIATRMAEADLPTILLDADVARFGLTKPIVRLIEAHSIPFATLPAAKALVDESHQLHLGTYRGAASPTEVRVAIETADCLLCVGVRFTDTATGFFSHRLRSEALINIRAFDVTVGTTHMPGVAGSEVLSALVKALRVKPRRILPPRLQPPIRLSQFRQSLTQDRFWQRMQDFIRPGDVVLTDVGTSSAGTAGLRMPNGVSVIGQPLWAAVGYSLPALLGTLLAAPRRRQLLFIGDGAFQMTAQELSTILRRGLKPIIFLLNNNGYTIERLILCPGSNYNDINAWRYAEAASFFDTQDHAIVYSVRTEDELEGALAAAARDREALVLIELVMSRLDAPGDLVNFARRCAEFNFPQLATLRGHGP